MAVSKKTPAPERGIDQLLAEAGELIIDGRLVKAPTTPEPAESASAGPVETKDKSEVNDNA